MYAKVVNTHIQYYYNLYELRIYKAYIHTYTQCHIIIYTMTNVYIFRPCMALSSLSMAALLFCRITTSACLAFPCITCSTFCINNHIK